MSDHYDRYNGMENLLSTNLASLGTDCISRHAAIDALYSVDEYNSRSVKAIKQLPPIQPKRGKWIDLHIKEEVYGEMYKCSVCGDFDFGGCFCPNCGADMRSDDMREVTT